MNRRPITQHILIYSAQRYKSHQDIKEKGQIGKKKRFIYEGNCEIYFIIAYTLKVIIKSNRV